MKQLLSAVERQIKLEQAKVEQRKIMLANKHVMVFSKSLPTVNEEYLQELKDVLPILKYLSNPIPEWCEIKEESIDIPDELMPLFNKIGMQLRFHKSSGKGEVETIASILWNAQKFFHQFKPPVKE